jgi:VanZ family protein
LRTSPAGGGALSRWLPVVAWAGLIWTFSTDWFSGSGTGWILVPLLEDVLPWLGQEQIQLAHAGIRKLAHMTEYAVLALLLFRALHDARRPARSSAAIALALSVAWAVIDEIHQSFVPSRTAAVGDVLFDAAGAALALAVLLAVWQPGRGLRAFDGPR